jgi:nucleoside-triphosphatase THEP1
MAAAQDAADRDSQEKTMSGETFRQGDIAVAGVAYDGGFDIDAVLSTAVDLMRSSGVRVGGLLQRFGEQLPGGKRSMFVEELSSGERIRLDLPRGPEASGCVLDPDGLNRAACALRDAIAQRPDVLMVNRFGKQEAEGRGMRAELAEAVSSGLRTVIAVPQSLLGDWEKFLGEPAYLLKPDPTAIANWACRRIQSSAQASPGAK